MAEAVPKATVDSLFFVEKGGFWKKVKKLAVIGPPVWPDYGQYTLTPTQC